MLRLVEDDCTDAEAATSWSLQSGLDLHLRRAAYNLVRMRSLAAAVPVVFQAALSGLPFEKSFPPILHTELACLAPVATPIHTIQSNLTFSKFNLG